MESAMETYQDLLNQSRRWRKVMILSGHQATIARSRHQQVKSELPDDNQCVRNTLLMMNAKLEGVR